MISIVISALCFLGFCWVLSIVVEKVTRKIVSNYKALPVKAEDDSVLSESVDNSDSIESEDNSNEHSI